MKPLTVARDLQRRRARERTGLFTAEGVRCVEELLCSSLRLRSVIVSPILHHTERGALLEAAIRAAAPDRGFEVAQCSDEDIAQAAGTDTPQGIVAIAEQPERSFESIGDEGTILVLDGVQDPGNVGTILRTAQAFAAAATIALPGTADLWNPKVVRAAMGALFSHVAFAAGTADAIAYLGGRGIPIWATSASGEALRSGSGGGRVAIVVGNEANGVSEPLAAVADRTVAIPIRNVESLNVAVATGILLYAMATP